MRAGSGISRGMDAIPPELWPCVLGKLPNSALCSLSASNKACWRLSCYKRTLKVELDANQQLSSRLVSLLHFLTSRRKHLEVCCLQCHLVDRQAVRLFSLQDLPWSSMAVPNCVRGTVWKLFQQEHTVWLPGDSLSGLHSQAAGCPVQAGRHGSACVHRGGVQRAPGVTRPQLGLKQIQQRKQPLCSASAGEAAMY